MSARSKDGEGKTKGRADEKRGESAREPEGAARYPLPARAAPPLARDPNGTPERMLDPKVIRRLARIMAEAGVTELELDDANDGLRVRLKRGSDTPPPTAGPVVHLLSGGMPAPAPHVAAAPAAGAPIAPSGPPPGTIEITSPMVGTFYRSSGPDSDSYVEEGSRVGEDTVVCIIEAMKVMNEIKAETNGLVTEILVENGEPVEFGQPLFLLRKG